MLSKSTFYDFGNGDKLIDFEGLIHYIDFTVYDIVQNPIDILYFYVKTTNFIKILIIINISNVQLS